MSTNDQTIETVPVDDLALRVRQVEALIEQAHTLLPGLLRMPEDVRLVSDGRMREGEAEALECVLDVVDHSPAPFQVLADKDLGSDPTRFETQLLRDRLARRNLLHPLGAKLEELARMVRDTELVLGGEARRPTLAAYAIAKPLSKHDAAIRTKLAPALDFFGRAARRGAETRAKKADGQATQP